MQQPNLRNSSSPVGCINGGGNRVVKFRGGAVCELVGHWQAVMQSRH
jgi:hypothetical protein